MGKSIILSVISFLYVLFIHASITSGACNETAEEHAKNIGAFLSEAIFFTYKEGFPFDEEHKIIVFHEIDCGKKYYEYGHVESVKSSSCHGEVVTRDVEEQTSEGCKALVVKAKINWDKIDYEEFESGKVWVDVEENGYYYIPDGKEGYERKNTTQNCVVKLTVVGYKVEFIGYNDHGKEEKMSGMCADGASKVVLKISNLSEGATVNDISVELEDSDGVLLNDAKIDDKVFTQTIQTPEFFVRKAHSSEDRSQGSRQIDLTITVNGNKLSIPEFKIHKAPVVLLHGVWSDASTWDKFKNKLETEYGYKYAYATSYPNDVHFAKNSYVIGNTIKAALNKCKKDGIVAKKADVVAHSMGGLLTKLYGSYSNIKSITTVGTPHLGCGFVDILYSLVDEADSSSWEKVFANILVKSGYPATYGAIEDMKTHEDGSAIVKYNKIDVPTRTITGISSVSENIPFVNLLLNMVKFYGNIDKQHTSSLSLFNSWLFDGERNDWIVSESSQEGGNTYGADDISVFSHMSETENTEVMENIADFLHRTSNEISGNALVAAQGAPINNKKRLGLRDKLSNIKMGVSSGVVTITQPTEGTVFHPGDTVDVKVTVSNENAKVLIITSTNQSTLLESAPYNFQFVIPDDFVGTITIMAAAADDIGFIGSAKEVTITVAVSSKLTDITVYPEDDPLYLTVGETASLIVYGKYDDTITRKITSSSIGTLYTSANSGVAEVSSEGEITAKLQGDAVVTVENSEIKKEITVTVMADETTTPTPASSPTPTPVTSPTAVSSPTPQPIPSPTTSTNTGNISGYVVDKKGNPIKSARLSLKGVRSKLKGKTVSDADGFYEFDGLGADTFVITAKKKRYKTVQKTVKIEDGEWLEVRIQMKKGK